MNLIPRKIVTDCLTITATTVHTSTLFISWPLISLRSGSTLPGEGQHHGNPPRQEDWQQPHRQVTALSNHIRASMSLELDPCSYSLNCLWTSLTYCVSGRVALVSSVGLTSCVRRTLVQGPGCLRWRRLEMNTSPLSLSAKTPKPVPSCWEVPAKRSWLWVMLSF